VDFYARFAQRLLDKFTNFPTHARNNLVAHLYDEHARFTSQRPALKSIAQQVCHLC